MVREYHVLRAVHPHFPPAPRPYLVCEDPAVLGAPFFVMERRHGIVLREEIPPEIAKHADHPRRISEAFLDTMVQLHAIDVSADDLRALGKPEGYVERQVRGWADRWERAKTEEIAEMDGVVRWLAARMPPPLAPSIIHNDYKLDNVMLGAAGPRGGGARLGDGHARRSALGFRPDAVLLDLGDGPGGSRRPVFPR